MIKKGAASPDWLQSRHYAVRLEHALAGSEGRQPGVRSEAGWCRKNPVLLELTERGREVRDRERIREMERGRGGNSESQASGG